MIQLIANYRLKKYLKNRQYDRAIELLTPKARAGDAQAAYQMGLIYSDPQNNLDEDSFLTEKWLSRAAENNHVEAQILLGDFYSMDAERVDRLHRAFDCYSDARRNGSVTAARKLARLYLKHQDVIDININATGLLIEAAENGDYKATVLLAWGYKKGNLGLPFDFYRFQYWWSKLKKLTKQRDNRHSLFAVI